MLVRELQSLRKGMGIVPGKLKNAIWLRNTVGYRTGIDAASLTSQQILAYLLQEIDKLGDDNDIKAQATRNAFAILQEDNPRNLTERRASLAKQLSRHADTVEAYENQGIKELARRLNYSDTSLSQQDGTVSQVNVLEASLPLNQQMNAARNMVTQGLHDLYSLGSRASEIHETFGRRPTPYMDASVDIVFLPSKRGNDWYTIKVTYSFRAQLKNYRIGLVSSIHDCEILMASGVVDDVIKLNMSIGYDYDREITAVLNNCSLFANNRKAGVYKSFQFRRLDPGSRKSVLGPLWQIDIDRCEILEAHITEATAGLSAMYEYRWSDECSTMQGQYAYWYAPGLTYLNHLTVDTTRFPGYENWRFTILPFLGSSPPSVLEPSHERYVLTANSWIMQGQGVAVTWEKR